MAGPCKIALMSNRTPLRAAGFGLPKGEPLQAEVDVRSAGGGSLVA